MKEIYKLNSESEKTILMSAAAFISAGFPCEVTRELERVDLNEFVTRGGEDVFMIRVGGDSMAEEIHSGDWIIVDQALKPENGDIVVFDIDEEFTVKYFRPARGGLRLVPSNCNFPEINLSPDDAAAFVGVVTHSFKCFKKN